MALTEVPCLIGQAACGRVAGNPVCPKCGMDERVVYPGQVDREAAQAAALARYEAAQMAVKPPPPHEPPKPPTPPEPPAQPPKQSELESPVTPGPDRKGINRLGVGVLVLALMGGGWWWKDQEYQRMQKIREHVDQDFAERDGYQVLAGGSEVRDLKSGLVWARCSVGQHWDGHTCAGAARVFTSDQAKKLAGNGWRLPSVRDVKSDLL